MASKSVAYSRRRKVAIVSSQKVLKMHAVYDLVSSIQILGSIL